MKIFQTLFASSPFSLVHAAQAPLPHDYNDEDEHEVVEVLGQLSQHEKNVAARASYDYLMNPNPALMEYYAKQYARTFLKVVNGDTAKALKKMKATLKFRSEMDVDSLRTLFDRKNGDPKLAKRLEKEIQMRNVYVQGHDREGRSTFIFVPRNVLGHDDEWTIKQHVFTLEKAVASSRAPDKTVNAVVDFNGFSTRNAPPAHMANSFMTTFRDHYSSSINNIFMVDAPASFLCLWAIVKPLLGKQTRRKIHFVKSAKSDLKKFYTPDQAAPWMMRGGTKNRELDVPEYLYKTPFHKCFDE